MKKIISVFITLSITLNMVAYAYSPQSVYKIYNNGDINHDGIVSYADVLEIMKYIGGLNSSVLVQNKDIYNDYLNNGTSKVDDALQILMFLTGNKNSKIVESDAVRGEDNYSDRLDMRIDKENRLIYYYNKDFIDEGNNFIFRINPSDKINTIGISLHRPVKPEEADFGSWFAINDFFPVPTIMGCHKDGRNIPSGSCIMIQRFDGIFISDVGDVNDDGKVDILDAVEILKYVAGVKSYLNENSYAIDVACITGGKKPRVDDAVEILKKVAGLRSKYLE